MIDFKCNISIPNNTQHIRGVYSGEYISRTELFFKIISSLSFYILRELYKNAWNGI